MLLELHIQNLALVEELHVSFGRRLLVFTGETGAGKSIILQALALLSGTRASSSWIRTGHDKARVEALFELPDNPALLRDLKDMGIDHDGELVIRRIVSPHGSRFYLNGALATARQASRVAEHLVSVASQHDHQQLLQPRRHLDFVDLVGDLWPLRQEVALLHGRWSALGRELADLEAKERDKEQRRDFLAFQCREIHEAGLRPGEDEELTVEHKRLKASDSLRGLGRKASAALATAAEALSTARKDLRAMAEIDDSAASLAEGVGEQGYIVDDHVLELRGYLDALPHDDGRLDEINQRIDLIQRLKRKYGPTLDEVISFGERAERELAELDALDERVEELRAVRARAGSELLAKARRLSACRREVGARLAAAVKQELRTLSFAAAEFEVAIRPDENKISDNGIDQVEFLFSANTGEPLQPLAKIASGGELSRLMLALKCLLARKDMVETVVFDEIDSGISGQAAEAVAAKIKELSGHHQVLCITHLPQIAARADDHFLVAKTVENGRTATRMTALAPEHRVREIARMLGGEKVSEKTLDFAEELIAKGRAPVQTNND